MTEKMYIYVITCLVNRKQYVGQTTQNPRDRWHRHCSTNPGNTAIGRAIHKYGKENFEFNVVDTAENLEELNKKEVEWISKFNTVENGYNLNEGGNNFRMEESTKEKISAKLLGISKPHFWKPFICIETGKVYNTLLECAKEIDCNKASISKVLKGTRNNVYGYTFEYVKEN
jgi:GIY-YIG catalytic domain